MLAYWESKKPPGALPSRQHIDPLEITDCIGWISLVDVERSEEGCRFRDRLVGTNLVETFGVDSTGQTLDECFPHELTPKILENYSQAADRATPLIARGRMPVVRREFVIYDRMLLPLASDGKNVDMLIGVYEILSRAFRS